MSLMSSAFSTTRNNFNPPWPAAEAGGGVCVCWGGGGKDIPQTILRDGSRGIDMELTLQHKLDNFFFSGMYNFAFIRSVHVSVFGVSFSTL